MRPRKSNDGLPYRVYERHGLKVYSIGYKSKKNKWVFRLQCDVNDHGRITQLRREATLKAIALTSAKDEIVTVKQLFAAWFEHQETATRRSLKSRSMVRGTSTSHEKCSRIRVASEAAKLIAHFRISGIRKSSGLLLRDSFRWAVSTSRAVGGLPFARARCDVSIG